MTSITGTGTASGTSASFSIDASTNHASCSDANGNSSEVACAGSYNGHTYDISNRVVVLGGPASIVAPTTENRECIPTGHIGLLHSDTRQRRENRIIVGNASISSSQRVAAIRSSCIRQESTQVVS